MCFQCIEEETLFGVPCLMKVKTFLKNKYISKSAGQIQVWLTRIDRNFGTFFSFTLTKEIPNAPPEYKNSTS